MDGGGEVGDKLGGGGGKMEAPGLLSGMDDPDDDINNGMGR